MITVIRIQEFVDSEPQYNLFLGCHIRALHYKNKNAGLTGPALSSVKQRLY